MPHTLNDPDFITGGDALRRLRETSAQTDAGFRASPNPDPGFAAPGTPPGVLNPSNPVSEADDQLKRFRDLLIGEFNREPEPLPPARKISRGQALILGLAAAFNPEFGRTFVGPLLQEQINRPLQERALRQKERDRRINIGSQIISTLETKQQRNRLQAEKDRRFKLDNDKFKEQRATNTKNKELIDKRIEKIDDELQEEILKDPRILALKRKADILQAKLKRFINPLTGRIIQGKESEAARLATEEDLVIAQITELLNDLDVPKVGAEDLGEDDPRKTAPLPGSGGAETLDDILFGEE